ncbi:uncharacterized protein HMPREF1541_00094 [Cyphellophora europaea CBS 101466]|uniref:DUF7732 domain-containing protein n=1 Tax=Cyphellophora europaea (strain CBS 101466) TaxID=1220924 RepID=W2SD33_CYPE1|nr:uncharacterized protein HMPREF1541_00094 [Cyphellophora europaea CBS 101466]ETN45913.1 hypothetical protein HMPREF1541_00094 [Cyphellophora europaea CBS 101466]
MRFLRVLLALSALSTTTFATPVADFDALVSRNPDALHSSQNKRNLHSWSPREEEAEKRAAEAAAEPEPDPEAYAEPAPNHDLDSLTSALEKRKGGGGGRGGGSSGGSRGSGGSSGGGGRPVSSYSFSPQSNLGGRTISGSGARPAYGSRYMGGATVPYTAGARSPSRGIAPFAFPLVGFAVFPGLWLYGSAYGYPYGAGYHYNQDGQNHTSNVTCLCQRYQVCGCDPDDNQTALAQMVTNGTGSGAPVNTSTVRTVQYDNGTEMTYINGSLENGTTAPGGTEPSDESQISAAVQRFMSVGGYWLMATTVVWGVYMGGLP